MNIPKKLVRVPKGLEWIEPEVVAKPLQVSAVDITEQPIVENLKIDTSEYREPMPVQDSSTVNNNQNQTGITAGWTRATFIVKEEHLEMIKVIAYWDQRAVKDVIDEALEHYLSNKNLEEYLKHKRPKKR